MEEIKAGDIMIGNYYHYQFNDKICKVESIVKDDNWHGGYKVISECGQITGIAACCPIPLTEDILLKCGFEKLEPNVDKITQEEINKGKLITVTIYRLCPITFNTSNGWWLYNKYMDNPPKHLHQLQNLFKSLTGNDLKIEV